jgi:hypothetical protein
MYGVNGIDADNLGRKDRVLIKLHQEYESKPSYYSVDGVNKLAGLIKTQGGISNLIKEFAQTDAKTSKSSTIVKAVATQAIFQAIEITDDMRLTALKAEAKEYFALHKSNQKITFNPPIVSNKEGFGIALFKRLENLDFGVFGSVIDSQTVDEIMVYLFRKQYAALPKSMRCFFEIIKTQSLPSNLVKLYDKLIEKSKLKHEDGEKRKIQRRVMYIAEKQQLVLSPVYAESGVVTVAKLKNNPFEGQVSDCFMPTRCRKVLEQRMLATHDFNMFKPNSPEIVPRFAQEGLASHVLRLDNKALESDFVFVEFWPFEQQMGLANEQLIFNENHTLNCLAKVTLPASFLKTFAVDHADPWLTSYGNHVTRPANTTVELSISENGFKLGYDYVDGL